MITTTLLGASLTTLIAALGLALVFRRLARNNTSTRRESMPEVSLARYRPMERLLAAEEFEFLARQPGYEPRLGRRLRAERRSILRQYLRLMAKDFHRVYRAAQVALIQSPEDRPDLAGALIRLRVQFLVASLALQCRLALHPFGLPRLELRPLLAALERIAEMARQISAGQLAPQGALR